MKQLKLFFALFAMLALGAGNAWGETTISFGYSNWDGVTANFSGTAKDEVTQTVDGIKVTYTRNGSNLYANTSAIRFYKSNTLKFDAPTGYSIQSISFTCTSYKTDITSNVGTCTATSSNLSWSGDATSVTFTRPSSASSYATITGATVTLAATSGGSTPDPGTGEGGDDPDTPGAGGSGTIVIKYNSTFTPSLPTASGSVNTTATAHTAEGLSFKEKGIYKGSSNNYLMFVQNKGFIYNTQSLGTITSVSVTYTSQTSTSGKAGVYFGTAEQSTYTTTSNNTIKGQNQTETWTNTTEGNGFFQLSTSNKNVQITQIAITYTSGSEGGGSGETVPSLTQEQFSWSATTATATLPDQFDSKPTLTNTENLDVTYSSSNEDVAKIDASGNVTLVGKGETIISATAGDDETYKKTTVSYTLTVKPAPLAPIAGGVIDILNQGWTGVTGTSYTDVAAKTAENDGHSNAQYVAQCAGDKSSIQLRSSNSNSGLVSTVSGGIVKRVEVEWQNETAAGRVLQVYGSNTAYTATTELYSNETKGTLLGEITMGGDETVVDYSQWTGDYNYIGVRSKSGAMYLTTVTITWLPINSKVTIDDAIQNGSVSVRGATDLNAVAAGTELTLSNTPASGYKLSAYDVYKTDDNTTKVTVTDGKFIMPEFDVTISATFELAKTLTGIEITNAATQTTFWQGETFNSTGLKVTAHFDGASDEDVTDKVTVTGSTSTAGAAVEVTVSFTEGTTTTTTTYTINVKAIPNTKETAYTIADAFDIIDKLTTAGGVFIKGIVSQVDEYLSNYKSITYWISADGTTTKQLQVYSGKGLESADFSGKTDLSVGDQVIVCGNLKKYSETYEFDKNNYLASHTPTTKDPAGLAYATTSYTANVGEAFTTPELTNPNNLVVTYSTSDASKATVDANTGAVTIIAAGEVTITATTIGDATHDAGSASYTITISNPAMAVATLPFTFNSGKADIENTAGMSQEGLGSDYNATTKLKFDNPDDWVIIHFDSEPGQLSYEIKGNGFSGGKFTVQQSVDGSTYTEVVTYTELGDAATKEHELAAESRYVKFIYTTKSSGNVGLGDIKITKFGETPVDPEVPEVPEEPTLSAAVYQKVTSAPADWSGEYILVYEQEDVTDCYVWNGKDENNGYIVATRNNDIISGAFATITIAPMTDGYSVRVNGGDKSGMYIGGVSNSNTISYSDEAILNTIEFSEDGIDLTSNTSVMRFNAASNTLRFRYYKSGQSAVQLYKKLVYTREVISGNFGTICLPYGSTKYSGATFYEIAYLEMNGTDPYRIYLDEVEGGVLEAGKPYIFQAKSNKITVAYEGEASSLKEGVKGLVGILEDSKVVNGQEGVSNILTRNYVISGTKFYTCGTGCSIYKNRAYIDASIIANHTTPVAEMPGRRRIAMGAAGENQATGVDNTLAPKDNVVKVIENGQLIIIRDGVKYNVQGQKL